MSEQQIDKAEAFKGEYFGLFAPDDMRGPELISFHAMTQMALEDGHGAPLGHATFTYQDGLLTSREQFGVCHIDVTRPPVALDEVRLQEHLFVEYYPPGKGNGGYVVFDGITGKELDGAEYHPLPDGRALEVLHHTKVTQEHQTALQLPNSLSVSSLLRSINRLSKQPAAHIPSYSRWVAWRACCKFDESGRKVIEIAGQHELGQIGTVGFVREFTYSDLLAERDEEPEIAARQEGDPAFHRSQKSGSSLIYPDQHVPPGGLALALECNEQGEFRTRYYYDEKSGLLMDAKTFDSEGKLKQIVLFVRDELDRIVVREGSLLQKRGPAFNWRQHFSYDS